MTPLDGTPFNMAEYAIGRAARSTPDKTALLVYDTATPERPQESWTFAEIEDAILRLAAGLAERGLKPGDRIAIRLGNSSQSALLFFAAMAGGFIALPLSDQLTATELKSLLEDSGATAIATSSPLTDDIMPGAIVLTSADVALLMRGPTRADYAPTAADDPAFLIYTSGTTSKPKGVLHAQRSALGRRPMYQGWYGITPDDRMLHAGAFNWTFTLGVGLTDPWANGATAIVCTGDKAPELWPALIASTGATLFAAVPGVYRQILKYARPERGTLGQLRHGLTAGETPPPGLIEEWTATTGLPLYEALGMSEISTYISTGPDVPYRSGTVGKPQAGRRIAILPADGGNQPLPTGDEGLIAVHRTDPGLMLGYWNRPDEEAEVMRGEWFVGGDLGSIDADGYVTHLGRANELMNAGGYRVSPLEIEAALAACPGVAEVACSELRTRSDVSIIGAFVVGNDAEKIDADTVKAFASERLAAYKVPKEIVFVDKLPRTANGKVQRKALKLPLSPRGEG
ncbi:MULTISPECIES: class I adenylate-forming enzyme family protein [unclassified Hyphomicrobium]|uniref:class I adenylate-forming enzyme family protein n=1 Tax=unclassified Hyphomicrobium TaxID=2619925 RepID=UPI000213DF5A|nr:MULTISPECIES: class I adenylate-forming enzyme family protein [unclassified Hyphomicrobium]CCB65159.1 putative Long-chain acyl-CoA synthetase [Hyphomicrobium sp. MC1]